MPVEIFSWPKWWYSEGLWWLILQSKNYILHQAKNLRLAIWVRYLFVPMFGMSDPISRLISFFIRLLAIIGKLLLLGLMSLIVVGLLSLYVCLPPLIIYLFIQQLL